MIDLERSELVCLNISCCGRVESRFCARDSIDEPEHHLAAVAYGETGVAQQLVSRREQAEYD